mmetsp:Transcript_3581/g.6865  ORF Transcript_3581/g.6865 Transcript_3581/m.6865 type:complete len:103 (-) Transcript_3581:993-1301(-)
MFRGRCPRIYRDQAHILLIQDHFHLRQQRVHFVPQNARDSGKNGSPQDRPTTSQVALFATKGRFTSMLLDNGFDQRVIPILEVESESVPLVVTMLIILVYRT